MPIYERKRIVQAAAFSLILQDESPSADACVRQVESGGLLKAGYGELIASGS